MKTMFKIAALAIVTVLLGTGCMEYKGTITVNSDGSGTIEVKQVMSAQAAGQLAAMGNMGDEKKSVKEMIMDKEKIKKMAKTLGPSVKLKEHKYIENKDGSKGSIAVFTFKDITKVTFGDMDSSMGSGGNRGGGEDEEKDDKVKYSFAFEKKGGECLLTIIPKMPKAKGDAPKKKMTDQELQQAMGMMQMMSGLKIQQVVKVNGKITKTDAAHVSKKKDAVLLQYIDLDKLMQDKEAFKEFMANQEDYAASAKIKSKGLKFENPEKKVTIRFK